MDLRTFIKQALVDIVNGVKDAQTEAGEGVFVPGGTGSDYEGIRLGVTHLQTVDFTVSVAVDNTEGRKAKIGVVSAIIGAGMESDRSQVSGHTSVLKFKIPIQLPKSGEAEYDE
jgi:hypothetical protein